MPVEWVISSDTAPALSGAFSPDPADTPHAQLRLWPYRSLSRKGFVIFIGTTFCMILVPMIPLLGTPVLWGLLPFVMGALAAIYYGLSRNYRDAELIETLTLWTDRIAIFRQNPRGHDQQWQANPHWVQIDLAESGGPVPNYLTLRGAGRVVELGAFLAPDERIALYRDLRDLLRRTADP